MRVLDVAQALLGERGGRWRWSAPTTSVELRERARERRQRIAGLGSFDDLRQLVLGGVR